MVLSAALALTSIATARAENVIQLAIAQSGTNRVVIADASFAPRSGEMSAPSGTLHVLIQDPRGTSVGWTVTLVSSAFIADLGPHLRLALPSSSIEIRSAGAPVVIAGQAANEHGPKSQTLAGAALHTPRVIAWSEAGAGSGEYSESLDVTLNAPAGIDIGLFHATLTVAFTASP
jgi:hypothetical protein